MSEIVDIKKEILFERFFSGCKGSIKICRPISFGDGYCFDEYGLSHLVSVGDGFYHIRVIRGGKDIYLPVSSFVLESVILEEVKCLGKIDPEFKQVIFDYIEEYVGFNEG